MAHEPLISMSQYGWDNCPYMTRKQGATLRGCILYLLSDNLIGIYLHGSLAMGCFNPRRSDIDLIVVTRRGITPEVKRRLVALLLNNSAPYEPSVAMRPVEIS